MGKNENQNPAIVNEGINLQQLKAENDRKMAELEARCAALQTENAKLKASRATGFKSGSCNAKAAAYVKLHELGDYTGINQPAIKLQDLVRALILEDAKLHEADGKYEVQPATCCHQLRSHFKKQDWKVEQDAEIEG
jgi:hypothetical protein